jgi:hypothetical protein
MATVHATLIDYKFRALMSSINHRKKAEKQTKSKMSSDFQVIAVACPRVEDVMEEEDQSFQLNGIIVEPKQELTEQEKLRYKQEYQRSHPLLSPPYWMPNNMTELLLHDEGGKIKTDETICKSLYREFTAIMSKAYE